jgi:glycosyltransferase involved in cell wall biosynthesis
MKVSIIVPNYNHERVLQQRMETILKQTYTDFEVIILDDCSTDNSRNVIEQYSQHPKVSKIIYNEKNSGSTFKQWHKGMQLAVGDLVWIAESDDWCEPDFLEVLVNGFEKNPGCVIAFAQSYSMIDNNNVRWQSRHRLDEECISGQVFLNKRLVYGCTIFNASMAIFKREYALLMNNDYTSFKMAGDWLFWINMTKYGDVFISGKVLNYFRKGEENVSSKIYASGYNYLEELTVLQMLRQKNCIDEKLVNSSIFNKYNNFLRRKGKLKSEDVHLIYKKFYELMDGKFNFRQFIVANKVSSLLKKIKLRLSHSLKPVH